MQIKKSKKTLVLQKNFIHICISIYSAGIKVKVPVVANDKEYRIGFIILRTYEYMGLSWGNLDGVTVEDSIRRPRRGANQIDCLSICIACAQFIAFTPNYQS